MGGGGDSILQQMATMRDMIAFLCIILCIARLLSG